MDFERFLAQAWDDHAADPAGVALRLQDPGLALATTASRVAPLSRLAHHVFGEHLGRWKDGIAWQQQLAALPACADDAAAARAVRRHVASLTLCQGELDPRPGLDASDSITVTALAAAGLAPHDTARALDLLQDALAAAAATAMPAGDPAHRALAVSANNLAATLQEKPDRSAAERGLMLLAAQAARRHWAVAGGWLEVERAEYLLALCWLQAGDPAQAARHARACLDTVQAQAAPALEHFFAWEATGRVARAAGDAPGHAFALAQALAAHAALDDAGRAGCQASLDALRG